MTTKQGILAVLTAIVVSLVSFALIGSWQRPQIQGQLELAQTNLLLQASEWQPPAEWQVSASEYELLQSALFDQNLQSAALKQYQQVQAQTQRSLETLRSQQKELIATSPDATEAAAELSGTLTRLQQQSDGLMLAIGILATQTDNANPEALNPVALQAWQGLIQPPSDQSREQRPSPTVTQAARVLTQLWRSPRPALATGSIVSGVNSSEVSGNAEAEVVLQAALTGWFEEQALRRLYTTAEDLEKLAALDRRSAQAAQAAVVRLVLLSGSSILGFAIGLVLLIVLLVQRWRKGSEAILANLSRESWLVPWDWEEVAQVVVGGFFIVFFLSQFVSGGIIFPAIFAAIDLEFTQQSTRLQAISILGSYVFSAIAALGVLYVSLKPFQPLPSGWLKLNFSGRSILWGAAGYLCAIPLVIGVSLINQFLWNGQGGSNPILEVALQSQDWVAILCFVLTAAIAAPIFEETIFRGFLLPSLTRYLSPKKAILVSALIFASAHLSVSEVLPLTALGVVLGVVYTRSRSLFAVMLLHGLWNSNTLLSLVLLGSSGG